MLGLALAGCSNILEDFPDKNGEEYLKAQARLHIDKSQWDAAIVAITPVLARHPQDQEIANIAATAYVGRAGLRVLDLIDNIVQESDDHGMLEILAHHFSGYEVGDQYLADYATAVGIIEAAGATGAARDANLNFLSLFVYYTRIGVILNRYAFTPKTKSLRPGFDACLSSSDLTGVNPTGIPNAQIDIIYTSIPKIIDSAANINASGDGLDALISANGIPTNFAVNPIPCTSTQNAAACVVTRNLVGIGKIAGGIGIETGGTCLVVTP